MKNVKLAILTKSEIKRETDGSNRNSYASNGRERNGGNDHFVAKK